MSLAGIAELADQASGGIDFDDVAAMDTLLDAVANLADKDRSDGAAADGRSSRSSGWRDGRGRRGRQGRYISGYRALVVC